MKRLIALTTACAAAITLSSCSTDSPVPSEASKSAASSTDIQQVPAEEILAEFDLEGLDGQEIVDKLDRQSKDERNSDLLASCLLYTSPSPRDGLLSRMPSSA